MDISDNHRFDPSRITEAVERIETKVLLPLVRKASDEFYANIMESVQDYLCDNLDYNLRSHLDMLERENARMRREIYEIGQIIGPEWATHEERINKLREMDKAMIEVLMLRSSSIGG